MNEIKTDRYEKLILQAGLILGTSGKYTPDRIGKMAILTALIKKQFPEHVFIGFYLVKDGKLHIGPYQGDIIACTPIKFGQGVCGVCALQKETSIVADVTLFPGYIACDAETSSEIVVPLLSNGKLIAVLDIDHAVKNQFDETDRKYLIKVLEIVFNDH